MSAGLTSALWYAGRGTGVVGLVLLTVVVALGIATSSGRALPGLPRFVVAGVHRNAALLVMVLLGVHVGTLLFDPYAQLRLVDLVLPFAGSYRPLYLGMGTLGLDLLVAVVVTSLLRQRLGVRLWRAVHWLAYAAWPVALLHSLGTGTDAGTTWLRATTVTCLVAVAAALAWRLTPSFTEYADMRGRVPPPTGRPVSPSRAHDRTRRTERTR